MSIYQNQFSNRQIQQKSNMMNYYYGQLPSNPTNILTAFPVKPNNKVQTNDKASRDLVELISTNKLAANMMMHRQDMSKNLYEMNGSKFEQVGHVRNKASYHHHHALSDYQMKQSQVRSSIIVKQSGNNQNLYVGGGLNITNCKILEQNKGELHRSTSRIGLMQMGDMRMSKLRNTDSYIEMDRHEFKRREFTLDYIGQQMAKLIQRISRNQERIDRLERNRTKSQELQHSRSYPQMEQIGRILSLVEKADQSKNRDQYRKTIKMVEDLRVNILDCHAQINHLKNQSCRQHIQDIKSVMESQYQKQIVYINQRINKEMTDNNSKFAQYEQTITTLIAKLQEEKDRKRVMSSLTKFQGKMITFIYEQRLIKHSQSNKTSFQRQQPKLCVMNSQKQSLTILTQKTYYMDNEGYLLDINKYYLTTTKNELIRLSEREIDLLKQSGLL